MPLGPTKILFMGLSFRHLSVGTPLLVPSFSAGKGPEATRIRSQLQETKTNEPQTNRDDRRNSRRARLASAPGRGRGRTERKSQGESRQGKEGSRETRGQAGHHDPRDLDC